MGYQGFQEALSRQVNDLAELLGQDWCWVCHFLLHIGSKNLTIIHSQIGVGRDDGHAEGEFVPIFFRKYVFWIFYDFFNLLLSTLAISNSFPMTTFGCREYSLQVRLLQMLLNSTEILHSSLRRSPVQVQDVFVPLDSFHSQQLAFQEILLFSTSTWTISQTINDA
jgi:hypothetical protein